jgi:hypothetical protein
LNGVPASMQRARNAARARLAITSEHASWVANGVLGTLVAIAVACQAPGDRADPPAPALRFKANDRIVAIGDLHGDLQATRRALRLAGAIDTRDRWIGQRLVVVQTGDQLDRGDDEPDILALLDRLRQEARTHGGDVVALNGNHELMNVAGDFRYVTPDGFADYPKTERASWLDACGERETPAQTGPQAGRAEAYAPGGSVARALAGRPIVAIAGDSLFVHGGVLPDHVSYGLERINREASDWMLGKRSTLPGVLAPADDAPVWSRLYSAGTPTEQVCARLGDVLERTGTRRMIVGHTVQPSGISSACGERVWRIDVGLARAYGGPTEVLQIDPGGGVKVLR